MNFNRTLYVLVFASVSGITGCAFARVFATSELALIRGGGMRSIAMGTGARVVITNEAVAMNNLARLRIRSGSFGRKYIYLPESSTKTPIFELINQSTVRSIQGGEVSHLPFRIYRTNGFAKAELFEGPGTSYRLYKTVPKDKFVLVRDEVPGWLYVQVDEMIGWIALSALSPAIEENNLNGIIYTNIKCYNCDGEGKNICTDCKQSGMENCPSCKGTGQHLCTNCEGKGQNTCLICKGKNKEGCPSCKGKGSVDCAICKTVGYFECGICHSSGKIPCDVCDGTFHTKCYYCFGTKKITERRKNK